MAFCTIIIILIPTKYINIDEVAKIREKYNSEIPETGGSGQTGEGASPFTLNEYDSQTQVGTTEAISYLCKNIPYLCIVLCLTGLFFVISGIQYWAAHYL